MSAILFLALLALPVLFFVLALAFRGKAHAMKDAARIAVERAEAAKTPPPLPGGKKAA